MEVVSGQTERGRAVTKHIEMIQQLGGGEEEGRGGMGKGEGVLEAVQVRCCHGGSPRVFALPKDKRFGWQYTL